MKYVQCPQSAIQQWILGYRSRIQDLGLLNVQSGFNDGSSQTSYGNNFLLVIYQARLGGLKKNASLMLIFFQQSCRVR